jgi:hypothetical protein
LGLERFFVRFFGSYENILDNLCMLQCENIYFAEISLANISFFSRKNGFAFLDFSKAFVGSSDSSFDSTFLHFHKLIQFIMEERKTKSQTKEKMWLGQSCFPYWVYLFSSLYPEKDSDFLNNDLYLDNYLDSMNIFGFFSPSIREKYKNRLKEFGILFQNTMENPEKLSELFPNLLEKNCLFQLNWIYLKLSISLFTQIKKVNLAYENNNGIQEYVNLLHNFISYLFKQLWNNDSFLLLESKGQRENAKKTKDGNTSFLEELTNKNIMTGLDIHEEQEIMEQLLESISEFL